MNSVYYSSVLVVFIVITTSSFGSNNITPDPSAFTGKDVSSILFDGDEGQDIFPAAFVDFNSDKMTDLFAISKNLSTLILYIASELPPLFRKSASCDIDVASRDVPDPDLYEPEKIRIVGVTPGDFTGDGVVDVLVSIQRIPSQNEIPRQEPIQVIILPGNLTHMECLVYNKDEMPIFMVQDPLVLDLDGDLILDLFGEKWPKRKNNGTFELLLGEELSKKDHHNATIHGDRTIWLFGKGKTWQKHFQYTEIPFNSTSNNHEHNNNNNNNKIHRQDQEKMLNMSYPSSAAFVDTDGDNVPELIITTETQFIDHHHNHTHIESNPKNHTILPKHFYILTYEVIRSGPSLIKNNISFKLKGNVSVDPSGVGNINVVGQQIFMDIDQTGNLAHLVPYCGDLHCKVSNIGIILNGNLTRLPIEFKDESGQEWKLLLKDEDGQNPHPYLPTVSLRTGDYNLDGFPDLLATLYPNAGFKANIIGRPVIFENVPCVKSPEVQCSFSRTFKPNFGAFAKSYDTAVLSTYFDLNEDGLLDVIGVRKINNETHDKVKWKVFAVQNTPTYDANFIKIMVVTGRKCDICPNEQTPYGNILSGPIVSYETKTPEGDDQRARSAQFYKSSFFPMEIPFTLFGIGSTPNFIETLRVSVSSGEGVENRTHEWTQIIPNSQMIIIPEPLESSHWWKAKLFLTPSKGRLNTFGVLLGFFMFFSFLVLILQFRERREDKRERAQEAHRFHIM